MPLGDPNIIGSGAADAADFATPRALKAGHNPGDSALRQTFVHYVGLGHSYERLGDIDIDHHRQGTVIFPLPHPWVSPSIVYYLFGSVPPASLLGNCAQDWKPLPGWQPGLCFRKVREALAGCMLGAGSLPASPPPAPRCKPLSYLFSLYPSFNFSLALSFRKIQAFNGGG